MSKKKSKARVTVEKNGVTFTDNGKVRVRVGKLESPKDLGLSLPTKLELFIESVNERTRKLEAEREARHQATLDAIVWGSGYLRVDTDGNIHRIDPRKIIVNIKGTEL